MLAFGNREYVIANWHVTNAKLRIIEIYDSITPFELDSAVVTACVWNPGERTVGENRSRSPPSMKTMWIRCSVVAWRKLAFVKRIMIEWSSVRGVTLPGLLIFLGACAANMLAASAKRKKTTKATASPVVIKFKTPCHEMFHSTVDSARTWGKHRTTDYEAESAMRLHEAARKTKTVHWKRQRNA